MSSGRYCYPDSDVLINKYNIKDKALLDEFEVQKVSVKLLGLSYDFNKVKATCDIKHLKNLNKYLFYELYSWAGTFRTENFVKAEKVLSGYSVQYCDSTRIETELKQLFKEYNAYNWNDKDKLVAITVEFLTKLWVIHPFREGNTRTCITFLWQYLKAHNIEMDVDLLRKNPHYVRNSLVMASYDEFSYLTNILADALENHALSIVDEVIADASEKYTIAKEDYKAFKEKYLLKNTDTKQKEDN